MLRSEPSTTQPLDLSEASLDRLLEELTQRSDSDTDPNVFFDFLSRRLSHLSIERIAIWKKSQAESLNVQWPARYRESLAPASESDAGPLLEPEVGDDRTRPAAEVVGDIDVVRSVIDSDQPRLFDPSRKHHLSGDHENGISVSPECDEVAIVAPWRGIADQRGAIVFWTAKQSPFIAPHVHLPLVAAVGEIVARFQTRQAFQRFEQTIAQHRQVDAFTTSLHASSSLEQVVYTIANDGRPLVNCDRLSVVTHWAGRWKVAAISGAEHVHRHSPSARSLLALCRCATVTGVPLWQDARVDELPPQIADAMADYLDHSPASAIAIIPLRPPSRQPDEIEPLIGALVIENYQQDQAIADQTKEMIVAIAKQSAIAIQRAARIDRVPGIGLGLWFANHRWTNWLGARTMIGLAAVVLVVLSLIVIPADLRIRAPGELMPTDRREVFAPRNAVIKSVLVQHGQWVESGQPLLELRSTELELEMQQVDSDLHQARKRLSVTQSERLQLPPGDAEARNRQRRLTADEEQYQQQVANLELRQQILRDHQKQLMVVAPIAGQVLTWNAEERLATRPVQRGESLLSVADTKGAWQAELQVPGRHAGRLVNLYNPNARQSQPDSNNAMIASSTAPGTWLSGRVETLSSRLQTDSSGNVYLPATVLFDDADQANRIPLVPGATVVARVHCGRGSLAESLFFELADAIRLWVPF